MNVDAYVMPKPTCSVHCESAAINGPMSWRGQPTPHFTAASMEPPQVLGMPVPSPKKTMSNRPRSAICTSSRYIAKSGKFRPTHEPGSLHRPSMWENERSSARFIFAVMRFSVCVENCDVVARSAWRVESMGVENLLIGRDRGEGCFSLLRGWVLGIRGDRQRTELQQPRHEQEPRFCRRQVVASDQPRLTSGGKPRRIAAPDFDHRHAREDRSLEHDLRRRVHLPVGALALSDHADEWVPVCRMRRPSPHLVDRTADLG